MRAADFIVIGGGIAGLRAAIALAPVGRVVVLTKADPAESNTGYAQGGIAAAIGEDDSPALHAADTIRAGDGLCDEDAVAVLTSDGPTYVRELMEWGTRFERDASGRLALGREAAHSVRRVLHAGDATGREIGRVLWQRVSDARIGSGDRSRARDAADRRRGPGCRACDICPATASAASFARQRRSSQRAAPVRCSERRPTRRSQPATASRSRTRRARAWPISSSSSFIRRR